MFFAIANSCVRVGFHSNAQAPAPDDRRARPMMDAIFIGIGVAFFIACAAYTVLCERL